MEREVGGGIGMGNTCKPMAVSFQCMTKFTTKKNKSHTLSQKKKKKKKNVSSHKCNHASRLDAFDVLLWKRDGVILAETLKGKEVGQNEGRLSDFRDSTRWGNRSIQL